MEWLQAAWQLYLYQPLVNLLVCLYNGLAGENLGWAVVILTVLLRLVLLPFSILSERNQVVYDRLQAQIKTAAKTYRADPAYLKDTIRRLARKYKMRPWAKTVVLGAQLLVLVLLYQVFITGIRGNQLAKILYSSVDFPGKLNTVFFTWHYGVPTAQTYVADLGAQSILWPGIVAVVLIAEIIIKWLAAQRRMTSGERWYLVLFPTFIFVLLYVLPMVKSLFVLTSLVFSYILMIGRVLMTRGENNH